MFIIIFLISSCGPDLSKIPDCDQGKGVTGFTELELLFGNNVSVIPDNFSSDHSTSITDLKEVIKSINNSSATDPNSGKIEVKLSGVECNGELYKSYNSTSTDVATYELWECPLFWVNSYNLELIIKSAKYYRSSSPVGDFYCLWTKSFSVSKLYQSNTYKLVK